MTGRGPVAAEAFAQTLRWRQSSADDAVPNSDAVCGHPDAAAEARGVVQEPAGCGGFQRFSPVGGAAYGIPWYVHVSPEIAPSTGPFAVSMVGQLVGIASEAPSRAVRA